MPAIWQRHPRYTLFLVVALISTFYLLNPHETPVFKTRYFEDHELPGRLARANKIYEKVLSNRANLIKKFGPLPNDVSLFPPNKDPWPAYTVWDFFPAAYNCPHEVERVGALGDGGKWVCGLTRLEEKPDCVIYSIGVGYESSFEAEILANTRGCEVWGYDYNVHSFGSQIPRGLHHRTHFFRYGVAGSDHHGPDDTPPTYTLESLMKLNGHTHIDILKIDMERSEFEILGAFVKSFLAADQPLPVAQLQLEFHLWNMRFAEFLTWWEQLEATGLRPCWAEPNLVYQNYNKDATTDLAEYSFINIRGDNIFIKDPRRPSDETHGEHVRS